MSIPIIVGRRSPIIQTVTRRYNPTRGMVVTEEWASAGDNLGGIAAQAIRNGSEFDQVLTSEGGQNAYKSRLTVNSSGPAAGYPEQTVDSWQLVANQIQRDIKDHPAVLAFPRSGNGSLSQTLTFIDDFKSGTPPPDATSPTSLGGFWSWDQFRLYRLLTHGVTSYTVDQHVVRHTFNASFNFIGAIVYSEIPARLAATIAGIAVNGPNDGEQFKWGWKRIGYQQSLAANNRMEIATEWALASWPLLIYAVGGITETPTP